MSFLSSTIIFDIILVFLLFGVMFYAWRLNKSVKTLLIGRKELEKLLGEFVEATTQAQKIMGNIRHVVNDNQQKIQTNIAVGTKLREDLNKLVQIGDRLSIELSRNIMNHKGKNDLPSNEKLIKSMNNVDYNGFDDVSANLKQDNSYEAVRAKSKAELFSALKKIK